MKRSIMTGTRWMMKAIPILLLTIALALTWVILPWILCAITLAAMVRGGNLLKEERLA